MSKTEKHALLIYGAGKVGIATGHILYKKGFPVTGVVARSKQSFKNTAKYIPYAKSLKSTDTAMIKEAARLAKIIFITTKDGQIESTCERLVRDGIIDNSHTVVHTSGAIGLDALKAAVEIGTGVVSLHPMQSFAEIEFAIDKIPGSFFGVTTLGDNKSRDVAISIIEELGGTPIDIADENKTIYHAAACAASNYLVTLLDLVRQLLNTTEIPDDLAMDTIMPLVKGTISNIEAVGTEQALTGPIARGDADTISRHIDQLTQLVQSNQATVDAYKVLGRLTIDLALRKGSIDKTAASKMVSILGDGSIEQND